MTVSSGLSLIYTFGIKINDYLSAGTVPKLLTMRGQSRMTMSSGLSLIYTFGIKINDYLSAGTVPMLTCLEVRIYFFNENNGQYRQNKKLISSSFL